MKILIIFLGVLASLTAAHPQGWYPSWWQPGPGDSAPTGGYINSRWGWPFHRSTTVAAQTTTSTTYTTTTVQPTTTSSTTTQQTTTTTTSIAPTTTTNQQSSPGGPGGPPPPPANPTTTTTPMTTITTTPTPTPTTTITTMSTTTSRYVQPITTSRTTTSQVTTLRTSTSSSQPSSSSGVDWSDSGSYGQPILDQHNIHRGNHSVANLTWDASIAATALKIAQTCIYQHNTTIDGGGYGQNIGAGYLPSQVPGMVTNGMYNDEMMNYPGYTSEPDMTTFHEWGHFTQIVWDGSQRVGCATHYCGPGGLANVGSGVAPYFTVCNFEPPGNYVGEFHENVFAPKGEPMVTIANAW